MGVGVGVGEGVVDSAADGVLDGGVSPLALHEVRTKAIDARPTATLENVALFVVVIFFCKVTKFPVVRHSLLVRGSKQGSADHVIVHPVIHRCGER